MLDAPIFYIVFSASLIYLALVYALGFRLDWLRRKRSKPAPGLREFLYSGGGWSAVAYLFSARHRALEDKASSALVYASRALFCGIAMWCVIMIITWGAPSLTR